MLPGRGSRWAGLGDRLGLGGAPEVRSRVHRLVLCANDACGALGAIGQLDALFDLRPDLVSGIVAATPLAKAELAQHTGTPICDAGQANHRPLLDAIAADTAASAAETHAGEAA